MNKEQHTRRLRLDIYTHPVIRNLIVPSSLSPASVVV